MLKSPDTKREYSGTEIEEKILELYDILQNEGIQDTEAGREKVFEIYEKKYPLLSSEIKTELKDAFLFKKKKREFPFHDQLNIQKFPGDKDDE